MDKRKRLTNQANKLFKEAVLKLAHCRCEVCGSTFGITAHHIIPRSLAGHLMYYLPNGVCLCQACHFAHHTRSDPRIHDVIKATRGIKWYNELMERRKENHSSFKTIEYYENTIIQLRGVLTHLSAFDNIN